MAGYAVYIPKGRGANPEQLAAVGLPSLATGAEFSDISARGPDGGHGVVAAWRRGDIENDPPLSCDGMDWRPAKADKARKLPAGRFWFGQVQGKPVRPKDCERKQMHLGYPIELRDGNAWVIPPATNLPHVHGLDSEGEFCREVAAEFRDYWQDSEKYAVQFFQAINHLDMLKASKPGIDTQTQVEFTIADAWRFCCRALSLNYRLTPELVDMLGLLDDAAMRNVIKAAIDLPCILEDRVQKKTADLSIPVG